MPLKQAREIAEKIFDIRHPDQFNGLALEIFYLQSRYNKVYREFCSLIGLNPSMVKELEHIPYLPVTFYKTRSIAINDTQPALVFRSSGTTGQDRSTHSVFDQALYIRSILGGFRHFYGNPDEYCILALMLPKAERPDSSLAFMADVLIKASACQASGFYRDHKSKLLKAVQEAKGKKIMIFGTGSWLAGFCQNHSLHLPDAVVVETGGMKGMSREMVRNELHEMLKKGFGTEKIHSEYSMCELFSQAYSPRNGIFECPPWMKVMPRELNNPLGAAACGITAGINIIDLANIHTCAFIATQDAGRVYADGSFEVLGRIDHSEQRGCSLMTID